MADLLQLRKQLLAQKENPANQSETDQNRIAQAIKNIEDQIGPRFQVKTDWPDTEKETGGLKLSPGYMRKARQGVHPLSKQMPNMMDVQLSAERPRLNIAAAPTAQQSAVAPVLGRAAPRPAVSRSRSVAGSVRQQSAAPSAAMTPQQAELNRQQQMMAPQDFASAHQRMFLQQKINARNWITKQSAEGFPLKFVPIRDELRNRVHFITADGGEYVFDLSKQSGQQQYLEAIQATGLTEQQANEYANSWSAPLQQFIDPSATQMPKATIGAAPESLQNLERNPPQTPEELESRIDFLK